MDSPAASVESMSTDRQRRVILVVDDEDMIREVCVAMLEELGYETLAAAGGHEAVRLFREHGDRISLVLLDQAMPDMDGLTLFKELRRIRPGSLVLLASGYSESDIAKQFKELGLNGFIQKPFNMNQMEESLQRVLKGV